MSHDDAQSWVATRSDALTGKSILFLPRYTRNGPSSRLRMLQFIPDLEAAGARITVEPLFGERYLAEYFAGNGKNPGLVAAAYARRLRLLGRAKRFDLVWIEKELFPFLPAAFEMLVGRLSRNWIVDFDDAVFHNYDGKRLLERKLHPLIAGARCVTAGNAYLAKYAIAAGAKRVERIPTVVDPSRYMVAPAGSGPTRIGWIGTPANAANLAPVVEALNRIGLSHAVELVTIGAGEVPGLTVSHVRHAWAEETEASLLSQIDVGVMPLKDAPWERGKCGYKLIQYMAAGKPVVASPVGVNCEIVTGDIGFLAAEVDDWERALQRLVSEPAVRMQMGANARLSMERNYSTWVVASRLVSVFAEALM